MQIIDAHAHVGQFGGWANVANGPADLIKTMDAYHIQQAIICPTGFDTNDEAAAAADKYPDRFIPLAWVHPMNAGPEAAHHYIEKRGFKGIKLHPLFNAYAADDPGVDPIMEEAERLDVPVFIHSGHVPFSTPWQIALLAERHPKVRVVMIHMGHGHGIYVQAALDMACRYDNIWLEMSGMPMPTKIKEAYDRVGHDRIFFGTDLPFHAPQVEIDKVRYSGLSEAAQADVFYNNIKKFMGL
ncbi:amidohydrolase family protein [Peptococcus simiae]|uniref:amidohydrolase family protein n=1 Tax=Peptococcus simiae TaxID=1643805 RepID=UPI0039811FDF